jgi:hypothetical protein
MVAGDVENIESPWCIDLLLQCGVAKEVCKTTSPCVAKQSCDHASFFCMGIGYKFYRASHFAYTQGVKQDQKGAAFYPFAATSA